MIKKWSLLELMDTKGLTQVKLANMLKMSKATLNRKLNGHEEFKLSEVQKICEILGIIDDDYQIKQIFLPKSF